MTVRTLITYDSLGAKFPTFEDASEFVTKFNADDPEASYVVIIRGEADFRVTDLTDFEADDLTDDFLYM